MEKNEKFRLYFCGRANRTCFLLDGRGGNESSLILNPSQAMKLYTYEKKFFLNYKKNKTRCILKSLGELILLETKTPLIFIQ